MNLSLSFIFYKIVTKFSSKILDWCAKLALNIKHKDRDFLILKKDLKLFFYIMGKHATVPGSVE